MQSACNSSWFILMLLVTHRCVSAAGMHYLHSEAPVKVIHRDLKSRNGRRILLPSRFCSLLFHLLSLLFVFRHLVVVLTDFKWLCFLFQLFWQRTRCSRWVLLRMQNCFRALWLSTEKVWNCLILCSCLKETQAWDSRMFFNGSVVGTSASYQKPIFVLVDNSTF